jgi:uncharacterized protein YidB (DUF937 family)
MGLLDNVLRGSGSGSGMSPITMALMGLLAYRTVQGKGRLAEMLGRKPNDQPSGKPPADSSPATGGLGGLLGGLFGSATGGSVLSGGLADLLKQFQQSGHGEAAESWIAPGPNKSVTPQELEKVLGQEKIAWLMQETGMSREELLAGLSRELPTVVDNLTPQGRVPTEKEAAGMI